MNKLLCFHILLVLLPASLLKAQSSESDSLLTLLREHSRRDTTRINLINTTAKALYQIDHERMYSLATDAIELAEKLRYPVGKADGLRIMGKYHYSKSENEEAGLYFREALHIYENLANKAGISGCLDDLGRVSWKLGDYEAAREQFARSLKLARELEDHGLIAASTSSFGILSLQKGDYNKALEYMQESSAHARKAGDNNTLASNLHNMGYLHMRQSNYPEAISYFEQTRELMEEAGDKQGVSGIYLNMGIIYQNQGKYLEAISYYQKSSEIDESFGDVQGVSRCQNNIGLIYQEQGNYPLAMEYIQGSLKIKEEIGDKRGIASCLMNIGGIHGEQEDHEKALDYFKRSLDIMEELQDKPGISNCLQSIGATFGNMSEYQKAIDYLHQALKLKVELGERFAESDCQANLGKVYEQSGDYPLALDYYRQSMVIKEELSDQEGICNLYASMGSTYLKTGNYPRAMEYSQRSLANARELDLLDEQVKLHKQLAEIYVATRDYREAYESHVLHKQLYDSLFNKENIRRITGLEYQYNYERERQALELEQQKKDALLEAEARRQIMLRNSFFVGFLMMVLLVLVIWRNFVQKRKANRILEERNLRIKQQNDAITDSINYARWIQQAMFPPKENVKKLLKDYFILNRPRDIVSGDFYWLAEKENKVYLALADCTGHGVPGAFMSLLGMTFLKEIVTFSKGICASVILDELRDRVIQSLHQTGKSDEARDGMELGLCILDYSKRKLQYSGAFRPLYLVRDHNLTEIKGDKMPIGIYDEHHSFTCHEQHLQEKDTLYLFSDGYVDQIGGPKRKSFRSKNFRELLVKNHHKNMSEQQKLLESTLDEWKGSHEQIDDILVIGFRF